MESFGYYSAFANNVFDKMNGEINTTISANQLVIEKLNPEVMGRNIFMGIFINLVDIYENGCKSGITDEEMKGIIIFTILHELSHCDQEKDPLKALFDNDYKLYIEYTNNLNVLAFLNRNIKDMFSIFGYFIVPEWVLNVFHKVEAVAFKDKNVQYVQSRSFKDSLIHSLSGSCTIDFPKIIKETGIENITLSLNISGQRPLELEMIRDGIVKLCKSEMIYIENMFGNSKFLYKVSLSVVPHDKIIVNIISDESPKIKVVDFK